MDSFVHYVNVMAKTDIFVQRVFTVFTLWVILAGRGFGSLEVPKFVGSHPAEAIGFLGRKNPQHAFLRRGSKAVSPMS